MKASAPPLELIVGLGNPGPDYAGTRHNAGAWFVERLAGSLGAEFKAEKKFFGRLANVQLSGHKLRLLLPDTWMNESGKSVAALANFYRLAPEAILVAHDEIDLPCGDIRFKQSGGMAGHNGLRSLSSCLGGTSNFNRLRIGVGRPGSASPDTANPELARQTQAIGQAKVQAMDRGGKLILGRGNFQAGNAQVKGQGDVLSHVLGKASAAERASIDACLDDALAALPRAVAGEWQLAMHELHNRPKQAQAGS